MENNHLYKFYRHNMCSEYPDTIYDRAWYEVSICKQKDDGPITHATNLGDFRVIPEKDRHVLIFKDCRLREIPQNLENYDKHFDGVLNDFLEKIKKPFFKYEPIVNDSKRVCTFIITPYILLDSDKILHFERLNPISMKLSKVEFGIIDEFSAVLEEGLRRIDNSISANRISIPIRDDLFKPDDKNLYAGLSILERKLICKV